MSPRLTAWVCVNLSCLFWAGNLAVGRLVSDEISPGMLTWVRCAVAAPALVLIAWWAGRDRAPPPPEAKTPKHFGLLLLMAATGIVGYQGLLYKGLQTTTAFNGALLNTCQPVVSALMAWVVFRTRLTRAETFGIAVSMIGVLLIMSGGDWARLSALRFGFGDALIFGAVVLWAAFSMAGRVVMRTRSVTSATAIATVLALPLATPWAVLEWQHHSIEWSWTLVAAVAYVGIFASAAAFLAWNRAVQAVGPAEAAVSMNLLPLYAALVAAFALNEPLQAYQLGGGALVILGCLAATLTPLWQARAAARSASAGISRPEPRPAAAAPTDR